MANSYAVDCACGKTITVPSAAAGTQVACDCGAEVGVPGLSKLRRAAGQDAYITNAAEKIAAEHAAGREPAGTDCLQCGGASAQTIELEIVCETVSVKKDRWGFTRWVFFLAGGWLVIILHDIAKDRGNKSHELRGRHRTVETHIRLCKQCHPNPETAPSAGTIQRPLKEIPLFEQLFQQFPAARLKFLRTHTPKPGSTC